MKLLIILATVLMFFANQGWPIPRSFNEKRIFTNVDTIEFACLSHGGQMCDMTNLYYFKAYSANSYLPKLIQKQFNIHDGDSICIKKNGSPIYQGTLSDSMNMLKVDLNNMEIDSLPIYIQEPSRIIYQKK